MLHDTQIAHATRTLGWLGMLASAAWFAYRSFRNPCQSRALESFTHM